MDVAMLLAFLATQSVNGQTVTYTVPAFLTDTTTAAPYGGLVNPCGNGLPAHDPISVRLYGAKAYQGSNWQRLLIRTHANLAPGTPDSFNLYNAEAWTYWLVPVNSAGEGCERGITVGVPSVSVPAFEPRIDDKVVWLDPQGRYISYGESPPRRAGVYFKTYRRQGRLVYTKIIRILPPPQ